MIIYKFLPFMAGLIIIVGFAWWLQGAIRLADNLLGLALSVFLLATWAYLREQDKKMKAEQRKRLSRIEEYPT